MSWNRGSGPPHRGGRAIALGGALAWMAAGCAPPSELDPRPAHPDPGEPPVAEAPPPAAPDEPRRDAGGRPRGDRPTPGAALEPIPRRSGPLEVRVQYPESGQRLTVRDSNFIFGSVGTGEATLRIDGHPVPVEPNGAFLAFLPVPPSSGDTAVYRLVARGPDGTRTLRHRVLLPPLPYVGPTGGVWLDTTARPAAVQRWATPDEPIEVAVRGAPGLTVWAEVGGERFSLTDAPDPERVRLEGRGGGVASTTRLYRARVPAGRLAAAAGLPASGIGRLSVVRGTNASTGAPASAAALAPRDTVELELLGAARGDTARLARRWPLVLLAPEALPVVALREAPDSVNGPSGVVHGRPMPYGPYQWRFPPGARALVDGREGDRLRLRLAAHEVSWVRAEEAIPLPAGAPPPLSTAGDVRVEPSADRLVVEVPLDVPLPVRVREPEPARLELTLYGARGVTDRVSYGGSDPLLESVSWEQESEDVYRLVVGLAEPVWGYRTGYAENNVEGTTLRLEIRRPPPILPRRPLLGRRVAVDPGHPGGGAHGPTGLYEGDVNLAIARRLVRRLREAGAEPVLIRGDTLPMGLYERTRRAVESDAELFVSIHNNALPDGVRPFGREGTSTYHYHPHSRELASAVQAGMVREMGLRDLGVFWGDLAVTRISWMPSVLAEGAFMMIPGHEEALRRPEFQERYARGVLRGIREFLITRLEAVGSPTSTREEGRGR